jgi:hypothetical protein
MTVLLSIIVNIELEVYCRFVLGAKIINVTVEKVEIYGMQKTKYLCNLLSQCESFKCLFCKYVQV